MKKDLRHAGTLRAHIVRLADEAIESNKLHKLERAESSAIGAADLVPNDWHGTTKEWQELCYTVATRVNRHKVALLEENPRLALNRKPRRRD